MMNTFSLFANNTSMKKSTKILLALFVLVTIPSLVLGGSILSGIKATDNGFVFDFDTKGIIALALTAISIVLGSILYARFLSTLKLEKLLFFSSIPLIVIYGAIIFLIADLSNIENDFAKSVQTLLNLSTDNAYNTILWAILVTLIFIVILSLNFFIICRPMNRVEKVVSRLGDGKVKEEKLTIGGGKQFKTIEHGLNKINNNYKEKDNSLKTSKLQSKNTSKRLIKILGRNNVAELEMGRSITRQVTLLYTHLFHYENDKTLQADFDLIKSYYKDIAPLIRRFSGYIEGYNENGLTAVFARAEDAIECSLIISRTIKIKNRSNKSGSHLLERISILTSRVTYKAIGQDDDKKPTIISNESEILERIDRIAEFMQAKIIFTKSVLDDLPINYKLAYRYLGSVNMFNTEEIMLFEDLDVYPKNEAEKLVRNKGVFERGIINYNNGDYNKAISYFQDNLRSNPSDRAGYIYYSNAKEKLDKA